MSHHDEVVDLMHRNAGLAAALKTYLAAQPQCDCSEHSGCPMAEARAKANAALLLNVDVSRLKVSLDNAAKDRRSKMAIDCNFVPRWQRARWDVVDEIRAELGLGEKL